MIFRTQAYEIVDTRNAKLAAQVGVPVSSPGGMVIQLCDGTDQKLSVDDDNFEEKDGTFSIYFDDGMVVFIPLTVSSYEDQVRPLLPSDPGDFSNDKELNAYFVQLCMNGGPF